jgi:glyoxylase-like metal-dependent hydrolase (beta-lactamase superfamily II)
LCTLLLKLQTNINFSYIQNVNAVGLPFEIDEGITVIPTPGHTADDVSVVIKNSEDMGTVVIAGKIKNCLLAICYQ